MILEMKARWGALCRLRKFQQTREAYSNYSSESTAANQKTHSIQTRVITLKTRILIKADANGVQAPDANASNTCRLIGCVVTCVDGVWTMVTENVAAPEAHGRKKLATPAHFGGRKITNNIKSWSRVMYRKTICCCLQGLSSIFAW